MQPFFSLLASLQHLQLFLNSFSSLSFLSWSELVIPRVDCGIGTPSWADMKRFRVLWMVSNHVRHVMVSYKQRGIVGHFQLGGLSAALSTTRRYQRLMPSDLERQATKFGLCEWVRELVHCGWYICMLRYSEFVSLEKRIDIVELEQLRMEKQPCIQIARHPMATTFGLSYSEHSAFHKPSNFLARSKFSWYQNSTFQDCQSWNDLETPWNTYNQLLSHDHLLFFANRKHMRP